MPNFALGAYLRRTLTTVTEHRLMRPWRHQLGHHALWRFNRRSVSRGVGIGLFFGVLTPVAQFVFAVLAAILLRANLLVAAGCTLVTNPVTFPFIYYGAFRIGAFLTGPSRDLVEDLEISEEAAQRALDFENWWATLSGWWGEVGYPLLVGLLVLAISLSVLGYLVTYASWTVTAAVRNRSLAASRGRRRAAVRAKDRPT